jgi:hypothetical protein
MIMEMKRDLVPNYSIKEFGNFGEPVVSVHLLDGENWLPGARGDLLDRMEDDAVWVDRNTARLNEVEASTSDAPHEGLQGDPTVISIDGDFVSQSRISGPDDPHVEVSPAVGVQGPRTVGLVTRDADVVESLGKADTGPVGTLGLELQGHETTEAIQEGGRGAGPVEGGGTTETTRSPAGSRVTAGVSGIIEVFIFDVRRQRVTAHVSWGLVHLIGVQINRLHGGRVVWIGYGTGGAVAHGLPTAAKTTAERTVAVRIVHHRSLVVHCRRDGSYKSSVVERE